MGLGKTLSMVALILKKKQLRAERGDASPEWEERRQTAICEKSYFVFSVEILVCNRNGICSAWEGLIRSRATLVVCPASVMCQWDSEVKKRVRGGRLQLDLFHGPKREDRAKT